MSQSKLHTSTKPRLAMKRDEVTGELVKSYSQRKDGTQGPQDIQVAGTVSSLNPNPQPATVDRKEFYRGTAKVLMNGKEKEVAVIFNGGEDEAGNPRIAVIEVGACYWLTMRPSDDKTRVNFSCGGLRVVDEIDNDDFNAMFAFAQKASGEDVEEVKEEAVEKPVSEESSTNRVAKLAGADTEEEQE